MTTRDAIRHGEQVEAAAWLSAWDAAPGSVRAEAGLSVERDGAVTAFRAGHAPTWFFNRVIGLGLDQPARPAQVAAILDRYRELGVPHGVGLVPGALPAELPRWLEERGLVPTTTLARMVRDVTALPDPGAEVTIRPVGREDARRFGEIGARGFDMPRFCIDWFAQLVGRDGWRTYLAYRAGEPIATGALYVHGTVGWLGFGSTLPDHRGHGVHRAMLARRIVDAADLGCRALQTETNLPRADEPTPSLDNMKRNGFRLVYARRNYVYTP
jgi:GNAT superfamily N-acetyltransferase